jgi:hypothetical protein
MIGEEVAGEVEEDMIPLILVLCLVANHLREAGAERGVEDIEEDTPGPGLDLGRIEDIEIRVRLPRRKLNKRMVIVYIK